jgi:hypothetical protein
VERGSVIGWGTLLEAGRSRVPFPIMSLDFFNWPNPSSCTMALGSTQPLTEMSTRNLSGGEGRPARKADLTAICELIFQIIWDPQHLSTLWASMACYRDNFSFTCTGPSFLSRCYYFRFNHIFWFRVLLLHFKEFSTFESSGCVSSDPFYSKHTSYGVWAVRDGWLS